MGSFGSTKDIRGTTEVPLDLKFVAWVLIAEGLGFICYFVFKIYWAFHSHGYMRGLDGVIVLGILFPSTYVWTGISLLKLKELAYVPAVFLTFLGIILWLFTAIAAAVDS